MDTSPHESSRKRKRVALTPAMRAALHEQAARTGVKVHALVRAHLESFCGISAREVYSWLKGEVKTVCPERYRIVLELWQGLPERSESHAAATPEVLGQLRAERERTGVGVINLLAGRDDMPDGLSVKRMENFYKGLVGEIARPHLDYVLELWRALPARERVALGPEIISRLRRHVERSGKGPQAILRGRRDKPDGLNGVVIRGWLAGTTAAARRDHLDYVLKLYESPDERVAVTPEIRAEIGRQIRRTGVSPEALLRDASLRCGDYAGRWENWPPRLMPEEELRFLLEAWAALPGRNRRE